MKKRILSMVGAAVLATILSTVIVAAKAEATPAPSTTPAVPRIWRGTNYQPQCIPGHLCAYVWYNTGYYEFQFYYCGVYNLHYWHDPSGSLGAYSYVRDAQTGGVTTIFYGQTGNVLQRMKPLIGFSQYVLPNRGGWNPVWSIRVC